MFNLGPLGLCFDSRGYAVKRACCRALPFRHGSGAVSSGFDLCKPHEVLHCTRGRASYLTSLDKLRGQGIVLVQLCFSGSVHQQRQFTVSSLLEHIVFNCGRAVTTWTAAIHSVI